MIYHLRFRIYDLRFTIYNLALHIIRLSEKLQKIGGSAKSSNDFLNKLKISEEEADETVYWPELLIDSQLLPGERLHDLHDEARQLTAMLTASIKTTRLNIGK